VKTPTESLTEEENNPYDPPPDSLYKTIDFTMDQDVDNEEADTQNQKSEERNEYEKPEEPLPSMTQRGSLSLNFRDPEIELVEVDTLKEQLSREEKAKIALEDKFKMLSESQSLLSATIATAKREMDRKKLMADLEEKREQLLIAEPGEMEEINRDIERLEAELVQLKETETSEEKALKENQTLQQLSDNMTELVKESVKLSKEREQLIRKLEQVEGGVTARNRHRSELSRILKRSPEELAKQIKTEFIAIQNSKWSSKELAELYLYLEEELQDNKRKLEFERKARVNLQLTKQGLEADIAELQQILETKGYDPDKLEEKLKEERLKTRREAAARQALELMNKKLLSDNQDMAAKLHKERENRFTKKEPVRGPEQLQRLKSSGSNIDKLAVEDGNRKRTEEHSVKDKAIIFEKEITSQAIIKEKQDVYEQSNKKRSERTKSIHEKTNPLFPPTEQIPAIAPPPVTAAGFRSRSLSISTSPKTITFTEPQFLPIKEEESKSNSTKSDEIL